MLVFLVAFLLVVLMSECRHDEEMQVDCSDIYKSGQTLGGIYTIYPTSDIPVRVNCHMISGGSDEDNGGWTVRM